MGLPNGSEWIILVLVVVLLFGAKKLPEAARGLGRSLRIFKSEVTTKDPVPDEIEVNGATAVTINPPPVQPPVQSYVPPVAAPGQVPTQAYVPVQPAPVAPPVQVVADPTSVQSVNERFYGEERSDR